MGLKNIKIEEGFFNANGVKYLISGKLSTERYKHKCQIELEMAYGHDYDGIMKQVRDAYNSINTNNVKPADCAVKLYNIMQTITYAKEREEAILRYCALFINREDEDEKSFDEEVMQSKIDDWHKEGIDVNDFFILAANLVRNFKKDYLESFQNTSAKKTPK